MIVQIKFRAGGSSEWSSANPILEVGEPGYDITNSSFKIGDGVNNWNELTYQTLPADQLQTLVSQVSTATSLANQAANTATTATQSVSDLLGQVQSYLIADSPGVRAGGPFGLHSVTTAQRGDFTLTTAHAGMLVYDSSLGKAVLWNGTAWRNVDGTALA